MVDVSAAGTASPFPTSWLPWLLRRRSREQKHRQKRSQSRAAATAKSLVDPNGDGATRAPHSGFAWPTESVGPHPSQCGRAVRILAWRSKSVSAGEVDRLSGATSRLDASPLTVAEGHQGARDGSLGRTTCDRPPRSGMEWGLSTLSLRSPSRKTTETECRESLDCIPAPSSAMIFAVSRVSCGGSVPDALDLRQ